MSMYTSPPRNSSRTDRPYNPGRRHRADFARQATIDAFGWRFARALDQADFIDRKPGLVPFRTVADRVLDHLAEAVEVRDAS